MEASQIISFVAPFLIGMFGTYTLLDLISKKSKIMAIMRATSSALKR